jgi:DNA-binding response OmpR family regulator
MVMAKKILVVDDDPGILESLQYLLEDAGYEVITSEDGKICHRNFNGHKPSLILLDYWLPRENGGEITRKLKSRDDTKHIPIIIVSASYNIRELVDVAGADDFIPKPYDMNVLLEKVEKHIN